MLGTVHGWTETSLGTGEGGAGSDGEHRRSWLLYPEEQNDGGVAPPRGTQSGLVSGRECQPISGTQWLLLTDWAWRLDRRALLCD